jgi:hypothetical protein
MQQIFVLIRITHINALLRRNLYVNHDVLCMDKNKETEKLFNVFVNIRSYFRRRLMQILE